VKKYHAACRHERTHCTLKLATHQVQLSPTCTKFQSVTNVSAQSYKTERVVSLYLRSEVETTTRHLPGIGTGSRHIVLFRGSAGANFSTVSDCVSRYVYTRTINVSGMGLSQIPIDSVNYDVNLDGTALI